jgi:hypothetical protein
MPMGHILPISRMGKACLAYSIILRAPNPSGSVLRVMGDEYVCVGVLYSTVPVWEDRV